MTDLSVVFEKFDHVKISKVPKRMDGYWDVRYTWEVSNNNTHEECDWEGFATHQEAVQDLLDTFK